MKCVIYCRDNSFVHRSDYSISGHFEILESDISDNITVSASLGASRLVTLPAVHFPHTSDTGKFYA